MGLIRSGVKLTHLQSKETVKSRRGDNLSNLIDQSNSRDYYGLEISFGKMTINYRLEISF